jgi:outer membrane protein assembly factor BamB
MRLGWLIMCVTFAITTPAAAQAPPDPTDRPLWHVAARGRGMPAILDNTVFATTVDHTVVALSMADGAEIWRRSTEESGTFTEGFRVVAADGVVVVGDWDLYAFRADSGERLWAFHPAEGYGPGNFLGQHSGGLVFSGSPSGRLYAVDLKTGAQRWRAPVNTDVLTSVFEPATDGRIVVAGFTVFSGPDRGGVIAVDAETGRERWRFMFPQPDDPTRSTYRSGGPVLTADLAFVADGDGRVWALDLRTGAVRWSVPPLSGPFDGIITSVVQDMRSLAVTRDRLVIGSLTGYVVGIALDTRQEVWRVANGWLGSVALDDFTVADGVVYVPHVSGFLVAIDVTTGEVLWQTRDYRRGLAWPPAAAGDRVIAAGGSGFWALPAAPRPAVPAPVRSQAPPQED